MEVEEFLNSHKYTDCVKKGGLRYLLNRWANACARMPYTKNYFLDEYMDDLFTREVISDVVKNCNVDSDSLRILKELDDLFKKKTVGIEECLYDEDIVRRYGLTKERHWFYYRVPLDRINDWFSVHPRIIRMEDIPNEIGRLLNDFWQ